MPTSAQTDSIRETLSADVLTRTRASLADVYAAARRAEFVVNRLLDAAARVPRSASSHTHRRIAVHAPALDLLSLPCERWCSALAVLAPRQQKRALGRVIAAADACARTAPERANQLAEWVLCIVRRDRLPLRAPLLRHQLAGRALLVRARALIAQRAYADALPVIAEAHAAFPRQTTYESDRVRAQLLRGQVLATTGHDADALQTFTTCARIAIEHVDPASLVEALASVAVVLCTHGEFDVARPALALAAHVVRHDGGESSLAALHAALAECAFLGYTALHDG